VHSVDQKAESKALVWATRGTEVLIKTVGFKKTSESMWWTTGANASREWVPYWGGSNFWVSWATSSDVLAAQLTSYIIFASPRRSLQLQDADDVLGAS